MFSPTAFLSPFIIFNTKKLPKKLSVVTYSLTNRYKSNHEISIQAARRLFLQQLEHKNNEAHNSISHNTIVRRTIHM